MHQILYDCTVSYRDIDNLMYTSRYKVFAGNRDFAKDIVGELFLVDNGVADGMIIDAKPYEIDDNTLAEVNREFFKTFGVLLESFKKMTYKQFIDAYQTFGATYFTRRDGTVSYVVSLDDNEVVFRYEGHNYVFRDNLCSVYVGGVS